MLLTIILPLSAAAPNATLSFTAMLTELALTADPAKIIKSRLLHALPLLTGFVRTVISPTALGMLLTAMLLSVNARHALSGLSPIKVTALVPATPILTLARLVKSVLWWEVQLHAQLIISPFAAVAMDIAQALASV